ncbi:MAG: carboxypeptidase-like regulatory domain-containing protein [Odoribacter sp.]
MKWGILFCLLSCQWTLLCAQGQVWTTVKGRIVDDATNEPLAYATIALVKFPLIEDILKGVVTDEEGKFELKTLQGEYTLIIRNLGYRNYVYELTPEMPKVKDLGIIRLKLQPEQLGMVTVKPLVEISADEIKYDLSADPDRETASLHSILDKVPMIHRNPMGNIYVGELGKTFMIVRNGKVDVLFSGNLNDILKALPAKGFSSVTVMLAPPERYGEYDYVVNI